MIITFNPEKSKTEANHIFFSTFPVSPTLLKKIQGISTQSVHFFFLQISKKLPSAIFRQLLKYIYIYCLCASILNKSNIDNKQIEARYLHYCKVENFQRQ